MARVDDVTKELAAGDRSVVDRFADFNENPLNSGVPVEYMGRTYVLVTELGGGFGLAVMEGSVAPHQAFIIPLAYKPLSRV